eukprot:TRINITY_DN66683_c7_g2_i1.p1 TRINITY_DN66683_c7_g2~~TRINITY_DN66683_c7_g2_i1.p1  ORF type:complete len:445 (+),score=40.51 TRINITY_DN66683_c7_g2_i1:46-1380(+)
MAESLVTKITGPKGRGLTATSACPPGKLIFFEYPFAAVVGDMHTSSVCHNCFKAPSKALSRCSTCKICHYCSPSCQKADWPNHKQECKSIVKAQPHNLSHTMRLLMRIVRRLKREPGKTNDVEALTEHSAKIDIEKRALFSHAAMAIKSAFLDGEERPLCEEVPDMVKLICKIQCNTFHVLNNDHKAIGSALYLNLGSLVNHSCQANVIVVFDGSQLVCRSCGDIKEGDELLVSYTDLAATTETRRKILMDQYGFMCNCPLCVDETGTRDKLLGTLSEEIIEAKKYLDIGKWHIAREKFQQACDSYQLAVGQSAKPISLTDNLLAKLEILNGLTTAANETMDFRNALHFCKLSLPVFQAVYGDSHPLVGLQFYMCGKLGWLIGGDDAAADYAEAALGPLMKGLDILRGTHGTAHELTKGLCDLVAEVRMVLQSYVAAAAGRLPM